MTTEALFNPFRMLLRIESCLTPLVMRCLVCDAGRHDAALRYSTIKFEGQLPAVKFVIARVIVKGVAKNEPHYSYFLPVLSS